MKRKVTTATLILIISVLAYLSLDRWGMLERGPKNGELLYNNKLTSAEKKINSKALVYDVVPPNERDWIVLDNEDILKVNLDSILYGPGDVSTSGDEYFVSDLADQKIKRFTKDGKLLNEIGNGRGQGPGEFMHFNDFTLSKEGIFVPDANGRRISWFMYGGEFVSSFVFDEGPSYITYFDDSLAVFAIHTGAIAKVSSDGVKGSSFGHVIGEQGGMMDVIGYLTALDDKWIVYASIYSSTVLIFDTRGTLVRTIQTLDRLPFPKTEIVNGVGRASKQSRKLTDVEIDDDKVYVSTAVSEESRYSIIDRYDLMSGEYVNSIRLPSIVLGIDVKDGVVTAVQGTELIEFSVQ